MVREDDGPVLNFEPFPDEEFDFVLADPPWAYANWSSKKHGSAKSWYDCLTVEQIASLPVKEIGKKNSACFLWITGPKLIEAAHKPIFEAWGYRPVTIAFVWNKTTRTGGPYMGLGFYTRQNVEYCLLGLRGKMKRQSTKVLQGFSFPRRAHSQKPEGFHAKIEELFGPLKGIELFARDVPRGVQGDWTVWGNQKDAVQKDGVVDKSGTLIPSHNPNWFKDLSENRKKDYDV